MQAPVGSACSGNATRPVSCRSVRRVDRRHSGLQVNPLAAEPFGHALTPVVNEGGAAGGWPNRCEVLGFLNDFVESRNEGGLRASVTQDREAHPPPGQLRSVPNDFFSGSLKRF